MLHARINVSTRDWIVLGEGVRRDASRPHIIGLKMGRRVTPVWCPMIILSRLAIRGTQRGGGVRQPTLW